MALVLLLPLVLGDPAALPAATAELLAGDPAALALADALWREAGWRVELEQAYTMDGGWRGMIEIVPQAPVGAQRVHLERLGAAARDFAALFAALAADGVAPDYRWRELRLAFFLSRRRATPSAYAGGWRIGYNVNGSLLRGAEGVRTTLWHEIFHLNDEAHGGWSARVLKPIYRRILERCTSDGQRQDACLVPYAPATTRVKGGTFYAFHAGEGVEEYGAELAVRYYTEHRQVLLERRPVARPFKCRTPENLQAWTLLADEFFAGVDRLGPCPAP